MKVIFLDIDGVLNSQWAYSQGLMRRNKGDYTFSDVHLRRLQDIVRATGAVIVLSSTWRLHKADTSEDSLYVLLDKALKSYGIDMIDVTGRRADHIRGLEIKDWLEAHTDLDIERFIIIDDDWMDIQPVYPDNLITCNGYYGLTDLDAICAINVLTMERKEIPKVW